MTPARVTTWREVFAMAVETLTYAAQRLRNLIRYRVAPAEPTAGFTLVEMLVVLTIIALILGLVGPRVLAYLGESRTKTARLQIESFGSALDLFFVDTGRYPTSS